MPAVPYGAAGRLQIKYYPDSTWIKLESGNRLIIRHFYAERIVFADLSFHLDLHPFNPHGNDPFNPHGNEMFDLRPVIDPIVHQMKSKVDMFEIGAEYYSGKLRIPVARLIYNETIRFVNRALPQFLKIAPLENSLLRINEIR